MNDIQKHMLAYMKEVIDQEDIYFYEAWKQVEMFVLEALEDAPDQKIEEKTNIL